MKGKVKSLLVVRSGSIQQETYETASKNAGVRSRQLRRLGYPVTVSQMGSQVTNYGVIKLSMVTIYGADSDVPGVDTY